MPSIPLFATLHLADGHPILAFDLDDAIATGEAIEDANLGRVDKITIGGMVVEFTRPEPSE
jgi:hypothetical protein